MSSVGGIQRCGCEAPQPAYQLQARASYRERSTQTAGALSVQTDDGDVVNISFASQSTQSVGRYSATDGNTRVRGVERSSSAAYAVEVSVEGTLDDDEVEDIRKLLSELASSVSNRGNGQAAPELDELDSLAAFQFGFERTVATRFERAEVLERRLPPELAPAPPLESAPVDNPSDGQVAAKPAEIDSPVAIQPAVEPAETVRFERIETKPPSGDSEVTDLQALLTEFAASARNADRRRIEAQFKQVEFRSYERIDIAA